MKIYMLEETLKHVKIITDHRSDKDLPAKLNLSKQSLPQYKHEIIVDL
jgi:hypothetical protein